MEPSETEQWPETQPTQQATQNVLDPRRLGKQNSGFSDDEIADIICLLLPFSEGARAELREMAMRTSTHMVEADEAAHPNLQSAEGMSHLPHFVGEKAIVLRLSAQVKDPLQGFTFGRNPGRCDVYFDNDPLRRLSNIHFRIYLNEYGVLMLEDCSINGTIVDGTMLRAREAKPGEKKLPKKRTLNAGSQVKILMAEREDDFQFVVQIPRREGDCEEPYRRNLSRYLRRLQKLRAELDAGDTGKTITPGPTGHVDLFPANDVPKRTTPRANRRLQLPDDPTEEDLGRLPRQWTGSGRYNLVGRIGKGAFATVYQVTSKFDGRPWAAKELDKRKFMKNGVLDQKVENEMKIMQRVKHPNIVEYHEHLNWDDRLLYIIMEYVPNGDLGSLIGDNGALREGIVQEMTSQLLSALAYLHANNITHRDVKPDNILVQSFHPFIVKLTDFGLSKMIDTEQTFLKTFCGTLLYCAPEVYNEYAEYDEYGHRHPRNRQRRRPIGQRYDHAIDIWSLGGVLYYALTGDPPFPAKNGISYTELLHQIMTKRLNTQPLERMDITQNGIDFLNRMLQRRPEQRATVEELREHPWLKDTSFSQEQPGAALAEEEQLDDQLGKEASQLSLEDKNVLNDEAELDLEPYQEDNFEYSEFGAYESQKENYTFGQVEQQQQQQRLFGEVSAIDPSANVSAIRLNLPVTENGTGITDSIDPEIKDSFGSEDSTPRENRRSQPTPRAAVPAALTKSNRLASRSVSDLNNMTFDVASQDLGGAESQLENLNMKSLIPSHLQSNYTSFNSSKRKPALDRSDELDATPRAKPPVKRLKSESVFDAMSIDEESEQNLYSQMPPLLRVNSNRQIDKPVHKSTYWDARDKKSWHLRYPEMTQLQHDAFASAAKLRGEVFAPGRSPLWDLAMRDFPPAITSSMLERTDSHAIVDSASDYSSKASETGFPAPRPLSVAVSTGSDDMPDTLPPDYSAYAPAQADPPLNRIVATLESEEGSVISGIMILINQAMMSWGRATDNTHIYTPKTESKVPKYALKVMLWKEGYEPCKNFRPWNNPSDDYYFYISTKATHGIQINRTVLQSHDPKNARGPSQNWVRLHNGDSVVFWRFGDEEQQAKAKLTFTCIWGGSARSRTSPAELVSPGVAEGLDASCRKAEERIGKLAEYDLRLQEADMDATDRQRNIERERLRSQNFESKRLEACRVMAMRVSRRCSPASISPIVPPSSAPPTMMGFGGPLGDGKGAVANGQGPSAIPRQKSIPTLKHTSSNINGRTLHAMTEE